MLQDWLLLSAAVILTLGTGVFVAAEFSLLTVDRASVERRAEAGEPRAKSVLAGLRTLSTQLSGAQVGITITTLLVGWLANPSLTSLIAPALEDLGVGSGASRAIASTSAMVIATFVSMLLGELIPKNLAISVPDATAGWSVPLQRAFTWVMGPLIRMLNGTSNKVLHLMGLEPQEELSDGRSPEELLALVQRSAEQGTLRENTAELLTKSLSFSQLVAADVMTPRVRMATLPKTATAADVARAARGTGLSRFPVIAEDSDDVVGIVHVKSVVTVPFAERCDVSVTDLMREPHRVPSTIRLNSLLRQLQSGGWQVALVEDEYGGTDGLVTLEDVVEEIVGEVDDEHDRYSQRIRQLPSGGYAIPGLTRPDELREGIACDVPDSPAYETLAGFMQMRLERLGSQGDVVQIADGKLTIMRMEGRRIDRVKFEPVVGDGHALVGRSDD